MKKFLVLFLLMAIVSFSSSARKSYITLLTPTFTSGNCEGYSDSFILTGDVAENIEGFSYDNTVHCWKCHRFDKEYSTAEILNVLSEYGYEVEFVSDNLCRYVLSKEIPSNQMIIEGDVNYDNEVNISDVNKVISIILGVLKDNPKLLEQYGIVEPK